MYRIKTVKYIYPTPTQSVPNIIVTGIYLFFDLNIYLSRSTMYAPCRKDKKNPPNFLLSTSSYFLSECKKKQKTKNRKPGKTTSGVCEIEVYLSMSMSFSHPYPYPHNEPSHLGGILTYLPYLLTYLVFDFRPSRPSVSGFSPIVELNR